MNEEQMYTLQEAVNELKRRQCVMEGHDYEVQGMSRPHAGKHWPVAVRCDNCGKTWTVNYGPEDAGEDMY